MELTGIGIRELQRGWLVVVSVAVGPVIVAALPVPTFEPLRKLLWPVIRRGKLLARHESEEKGLMKFTVPQKFFTHFYILGVSWNSVLLCTSVGFALTYSKPTSMGYNLASEETNVTGGGGPQISTSGSVADFESYGKEAWRLVFLLLLFEVHLIRRLYECLFVSSFGVNARMSLFGYIIAMGYYVAVPLTLFLQSFEDEDFVHAFIGFVTQKLRGASPLLTDCIQDIWNIILSLGRIGWMSYIGAAVFLYGSVHQHACHKILALLRPKNQPGSGNKYGIPRGDWFELVSSAHYLAEIVIYAGLILASGATHPVIWIFFFGVVANLYLLAKPTHDWYLSKFDNYPKERCALFPYIG